MPGRPRPHQGEAPHDILAAEAFAVPAPDPKLRQVVLPKDPTGIPVAHDILAAEEFAMPAPEEAGVPRARRRRTRLRRR